jgi:hypothetical protein
MYIQYFVLWHSAIQMYNRMRVICLEFRFIALDFMLNYLAANYKWQLLL